MVGSDGRVGPLAECLVQPPGGRPAGISPLKPSVEPGTFKRPLETKRWRRWVSQRRELSATPRPSLLRRMW